MLLAILFSARRVDSAEDRSLSFRTVVGMAVGASVIVAGTLRWILSFRAATREPLDGGATLIVQSYTEPMHALVWGFLTLVMVPSLSILEERRRAARPPPSPVPRPGFH